MYNWCRTMWSHNPAHPILSLRSHCHRTSNCMCFICKRFCSCHEKHKTALPDFSPYTIQDIFQQNKKRSRECGMRVWKLIPYFYGSICLVLFFLSGLREEGCFFMFEHTQISNPKCSFVVDAVLEGETLSGAAKNIFNFYGFFLLCWKFYGFLYPFCMPHEILK